MPSAPPPRPSPVSREREKILALSRSPGVGGSGVGLAGPNQPQAGGGLGGGGSARLLRNYSIEVTARDPSAAEVCSGHVPLGSEVYIAAAPGDSHHQMVAAARRLHLSGFRPVPHILARGVLSYTQLNDLLARLRGDAGLASVLITGGDIVQPSGPYASSLQLLETGLFQKHGIGRIGLACYPEAHPRISGAVLRDALRQKLSVLEASGLDPFLMTQFCFEAEPIVEFARSLRANSIAAPLRIGMAGPADRRTLWKYAMHCGIGASIRALGEEADAIGHLLLHDSPDTLLEALAVAAAGQPELGIDGIHIFTFGGVADAAAWANAVIAAG